MRDYSATPLSKKLGAEPGSAVLVFFSTARDDLERRFATLRDILETADGLWVAWPRTSAAMDTDRDFDAVQQTGREAGLVDNKSCAIDGEWQASASSGAGRTALAR